MIYWAWNVYLFLSFDLKHGRIRRKSYTDVVTMVFDEWTSGTRVIY